jgi:hypothetical protein
LKTASNRGYSTEQPIAAKQNTAAGCALSAKPAALIRANKRRR